MILTFEELAVLLSLESDLGLEKSHVAWTATGLYGGDKFDRHVALATIDRLVGLDLASRDRSGFVYLTKKGEEAIKETKDNMQGMLSRLIYV